ncbi:MAG: penicillin-binding protein 1C [Burkholderiales bacterium]
MRGRRIVAAAAVAVVSTASHALPGFDAVRRGYEASDAVLLDRHGEVLHVLRVEDRVRRAAWVTLDQVSPAIAQAVVQAEDKRFFEHGGVDWRALGDAAIDTLLRGLPRGASTLTMQVAAMLEPTLKAAGPHRTVGQKIDQIRAARALETQWSKRQILEAYLNLSPFRGDLVGIGAAARGLFGKAASGVDSREAAILAALLRGPNAAPSVVARRACAVVAEKDCREFEALARETLRGPPKTEPSVALAPHLARMLLSKQARQVQTTLDARLQARVVEALSRQIRQLDGRDVRDAAALVIDNETGDVLAYAGNQGMGSSAVFVDGVRAARQAGSTLKPFLYAQTIEERLLTAASLLDDSPANLVTPGGLYVPQNYDREFRGTVSVRTSLSASLNVPAVRVLMLLGTERFVDRLRALGFEGIVESGDYYGYSLALGGADVTLWQLTNAYRTLAQGGRWSRPHTTPANGEKTQRVVDAGAAWIVSDILADRGARSTTFGLENPLSVRYWSAVKTGTSKDMRDNWCIGFSRRVTVGVWVGNFDGSPMRDVSGVSGAAPAWLEIMQTLAPADAKHAGPPPRPSEVVTQRVKFTPEIEAERDEVFLKGTEVAEVLVKGPAQGVPRIDYPGQGAILAIDPDIPAEVQRVQLRASGGSAELSWRINGEPLSPGGSTASWVPRAGRFDIELIQADGTVLDRVRVEVRGASARREEPAADVVAKPPSPSLQ